MDGKIFVLAIIFASTIGWVVTTWIRARHGYPVENEWGSTTDKSAPEDRQHIAALTHENKQLTDRLVRMEERVAVLERIATDAPGRLSAEIDALR
jgi:hypothetical protein